MNIRLLTALIFIGMSFSCFAQIDMSNSSDTACSGFFFDSGGGGTGSSYAPGINLTQTICPATGNFVSINFFDFDLAAGDTLWVYNGNSAAGLPMDTFTSATITPGLVVSIPATNPSGCLTFVFKSDTASATVGNGWASEVSCNPPCQNIFIQIDSILPDTAGPNGEVDVCIGDTTFWHLSGSYPMNNLWYSQSDANSTFNWYLRSADGDTINTGSGQNFQIPFDSSGGYVVNVELIDSNGCSNLIPFKRVVRVSTPPSFNGTNAFADSICFGFTNDLNGQVQSQSWTNYLPPFSGDSIPLPDGSSSNPGIHSSTMTITSFQQGQTVSSVNDIDNIWVNMEHSFLGDLSISLTCPNATSVVLKPFPGGGGNWLGRPCDVFGNNTQIGVPFLYEWPSSSPPTFGNMVGAGTVATTDPCQGTGGNTLPAGSYTPTTALSSLIGCPLNGTWTITIVDQWASDDGHLQSWGLDFDSTILPPTVINYDPGVDTSWWSTDPSITTASANQITVEPTVYDSLVSYQFNMTDNFGCGYDTTVSFWVRNPCDAACLGFISPTMGEFPAACQGDSTGYAWASPIDSLSPGPYDYYWMNNTGDTIAIHMQKALNDTVFGVSSGTYNVAIVDSFGCAATNSIFVTSVQPMISNVSGLEPTSCAGSICDGKATVNVALGGTAPYSYLWNSGGTGATDSNLCGGFNDVLITDSRNCTDTVSFTILQPDSIKVSAFGSDTICISNSKTISASATGGNSVYTFSWNKGAGQGSSVNVNPIVTTTFTVSATDSSNCPIDTAQVTVYVRDSIQISMARLDTICPGDTVYGRVTAKGGDGIFNYAWSEGTNFGNTAALYPVQSKWIYVTVTDQCGSPAVVDSTWLQVGGYSQIRVFTNEDDTVCLDEAYVLTATGRGGVEPYQYTWDNGLGNGRVKAVLPTQTTTYNVTISDFCNSPVGTGNITVHVGNYSDFEARVDTTELCQPASFNFMVEPFNSDYSYDWNFGEGFRRYNMKDSISEQFAQVGCHDVSLRVTTDKGCETTKKYNCFVQVRPKPLPDFQYDPTNPNTVNSQVVFEQTSGYASDYTWILNDSLVGSYPTYVHTFTDSGSYSMTLIASNSFGCIDSVEKEIGVDYRTALYIPSGFTPNGDGLNDTFLPEGDALSSLEMEIYNRWGNLVHYITGVGNGWDGTYQSSGEDAEPGVYIYQIKYQLLNGKIEYKRGEVRLIK